MMVHVYLTLLGIVKLYFMLYKRSDHTPVIPGDACFVTLLCTIWKVSIFIIGNVQNNFDRWYIHSLTADILLCSVILRTGAYWKLTDSLRSLIKILGM